MRNAQKQPLTRSVRFRDNSRGERARTRVRGEFMREA